MEKLQKEIQELEILLNIMTEDPSEEENKSENPFAKKRKTLSEMRAELEQLKKGYKSLQNLSGQIYYDTESKVVEGIAKLEFEVKMHIANGELKKVLKEELQSIIESAEEIINSNETLSIKEEKLEEIKAKYKKLEDYMLETRTELDKSRAEMTIARAILSVMEEKNREGKEINLQTEIPKEFAHEIIMIVQEQTSKTKDGTENKKKLAEIINKKIQLEVLSNIKDQNWNISNLAYNEELIKMYLTLSGPEEQIQEAIKQYYAKDEKKLAEEHQPEQKKDVEETFRPKRDETEVYKEIMGVNDSHSEIQEEQIDFNKYREAKIKEWKKKTKKLFIKPKPEQVTIITETGKPYKLSAKTFFDYIHKEYTEMMYSEGYDKYPGDDVRDPYVCPYWCKNIKAIIFGDAITSIPSNIGWICENITDVILNEGLEEIGSHAFYGTRIQELVTPSTLKKIDDNAFYSCSELKSVKLNEGLEVIGSRAFNGTRIQELVTPSTLKKIDDCAFWGCSELKSVKLNEGLEEIGFAAFFGTKIRQLITPSTLRIICREAFSSCPELRLVKLNEGLQIRQRIRFGALQMVEEPITPTILNKIRDILFENCPKLQSIRQVEEPTNQQETTSQMLEESPEQETQSCMESKTTSQIGKTQIVSTVSEQILDGEGMDKTRKEIEQQGKEEPVNQQEIAREE